MRRDGMGWETAGRQAGGRKVRGMGMEEIDAGWGWGGGGGVGAVEGNTGRDWMVGWSCGCYRQVSSSMK